MYNIHAHSSHLLSPCSYEIFIRKKQAAENTVPVSEDEIELDSEEDSLADLSCDADNASSCA